jgi:hypothetical protein
MSAASTWSGRMPVTASASQQGLSRFKLDWKLKPYPRIYDEIERGAKWMVREDPLSFCEMEASPGCLFSRDALRAPERGKGVVAHTVQIKKNATAASAMTDVASHPTTSIGRGSVSRPMMRGFIAITIMTAISGAASTPLTTAAQ